MLLKGSGTQTAALGRWSWRIQISEEYNGTTWALGGSLATGRSRC
jgi:hypothetical protein